MAEPNDTGLDAPSAPRPSGNLFYNNDDLKNLPPTMEIHVGAIVNLLRDMRELEGLGGRRYLWMGHKWIEKGVPVTLRTCKVTPTGKKTFKIEAEGTSEGKNLPKLAGRVIVLPLPLRDLDNEIREGTAPFYCARGAVEALEMALGLPPQGDMRKEERYLEQLKHQSMRADTCPNCGNPAKIQSPQEH